MKPAQNQILVAIIPGNLPRRAPVNAVPVLPLPLTPRHTPHMKTDGTVALVNARIKTGNPRRPWADALFVRDGVIEIVGSSAEVKKRANDMTQVIDARGRTVLPADGTTLSVGEPARFTMLDGEIPKMT
ncbi:MAG: Amidohydrolase 3 [Gemmatimonadetes bacterium]|nr:Amidohydrolase 3 [Gemmatimonadota bacterium]